MGNRYLKDPITRASQIHIDYGVFKRYVIMSEIEEGVRSMSFYILLIFIYCFMKNIELTKS